MKASQLVPNNVLLTDVVAQSGRTIIPQDTILTKEHIKVINYFLIDQINVSQELASGLRFTPTDKKERVVPTPLLETDSLPKLPFLECYENVVNKYKEMFGQWQNGLPIDMPKVREVFIPLMKRISEVEDKLYLLNEWAKKEDYLYHHAVSVGLLSAYLAKQLSYNEGEQIQIGLAGLLSDSGMAKINQTIFFADRPLMQREQAEIKKHPTYSYRLVEHIPTLTKPAKLAILQHHERNDQSGYPLGLGKGKIHPYAKIIAICDAYHAMTCERVYQTQQLPFQVIEELIQRSITKFDPKIANVFMNTIIPLNKGTTVQLSDGTIGKVVFIDPNQPARPIIKAAEDKFIVLQRLPDLYIAKIRKS